MSLLAVPDLHFRRYRQIAEVLTRHGLRWLRDGSGLERFRPFRSDLSEGSRAESFTTAERLRLALEELSATFIKLGQFLSTRADLLPPEYQTELAKLQDSAPAFDSKTAKEMIEAELGQPTSALFASFDLEPIAAASIGQAHAATLRDGAEVVVKVRRPGVVEQVEEDLEILQNLASAMSRHWEFAAFYDVEGLAQEFAQTLRSELNYLQEARNAESFARNFAGDPKVHIPRVFWEMTTSRALPLEHIRGIKVSDLDSLESNGIDRRALAERGTEVILKMIFEDGFFHADLHPGNFFIEPDGRFGLIDFGMAGSVDERLQERLAGLLLALASADYDQLADALPEMGALLAVERHDADVAVVGDERRLIGAIPIGRLLRLLHEEHVDDILRRAGVGAGHPSPAEAHETIRAFRARMPWLAVGLLGGMLAGGIASIFEESLKREVMLAFFLPLVVYMADAIGTQTETILVRRMVYSPVSLFTQLWHEASLGLLIGLTIGGAAWMGLWLLGGRGHVASVVALTIICSSIVATLVASILPWMMDRLDIDPAMASGPVATVLQDLLSVAIYLGIATAII